MKLLIYITLSLLAVPTFAADIYMCAGIYTDTPCGTRNRVILNMNANTPSEDSRVAAITRYYESRLYLQAREYQQREFELTKAYIQSPRITQTTNVTATSSSSSSSSSDASAPTRFIINSAP